MDEIRIEGLELACIVGIRRRERRRKQTIRLDLTLGLGVGQAGRTGRIALTIDYSRVADEVLRLMRFREYRLIEGATEEVAAMLLGLYPMLERAEVKLEKPQALAGRARSASVLVRRQRADFQALTRSVGPSELAVLFETPEAGLYVAEVPAGEAVPAFGELVERQLCWIRAGELVREGRVLHAGDVLPPQKNGGQLPHNRSRERTVLFVCTCPRLPAVE
jgi:7,8-dihydroneopterin aldolase/epimerase/oxygenase